MDTTVISTSRKVLQRHPSTVASAADGVAGVAGVTGDPGQPGHAGHVGHPGQAGCDGPSQREAKSSRKYCDRKLFSKRDQFGGKVEQPQRFDTHILIDDNKSICKDAAEWGQLAYHVPHLDFPRAVAQVIRDSNGPALTQKLQTAWGQGEQ